jgi:hypothetical protein
MKLNVLVWSGEMLGVYSSEEKAEAALAEFTKLKYFRRFDREDVEIQALVLDEILTENYTKKTTLKSRLKDSGFLIIIVLCVLIFIVGLKSCFEIICDFFK